MEDYQVGYNAAIFPVSVSEDLIHVVIKVDFKTHYLKVF